MSSNLDLRDQIKKFLEELIQQHPETTLDAIESLLSTHHSQNTRISGSAIRNHILSGQEDSPNGIF
jgi:hypothetical protein